MIFTNDLARAGVICLAGLAMLIGLTVLVVLVAYISKGRK